MSVLPDIPEAVILLLITLCIVGLTKVEAIGELARSIRSRLSGAPDGDGDPPEEKPPA